MSGALAFDREYPFEYALVETLDPMVRRVVARNPSPYTFHGTGTFIVGRGRVAIIDPGPNLPEHVEALLAGVADEEVTHLLVTHTHKDHSPACRALQAATGAPTYGYGPHGSGRIERGVQVEEGADGDFAPDETVRDGDVIAGEGWTFECVHTPGHTSNHVCFALREGKVLFTGDHVMAWNTSIISPPDGDMTRYLASLERLLQRDDAVFRPTHGPAVSDPRSWLRAYLGHRQLRFEQILSALGDGATTIEAMVQRIYPHLPEAMHAAAARMTLAAIIHLVEIDEVRAVDGLALDGMYECVTHGG